MSRLPRSPLRACLKLVSLLAFVLACTGKSGPSGLVEGQPCASPGSQGSCATGLACKAYSAPGGASLDICRATCTTSTDCDSVFTENQCVDGFCTCSPAALGEDACTADDPTTLCHPDFGYCAAAVSPDAGCGSGEAPSEYAGAYLCRPIGAGEDGGMDGGSGSCGIYDTQGNCSWPQFCSSASDCAFPQNVDDAGADSPDPACDVPGGAGNADQLRQSGAPFAPPEGAAPGGPIIITMAQDPSGEFCGAELHGVDSMNPALCFGDGKYCATADDVAVLTGYVYDPAASFQPGEGMLLDQQFFAVVESGSNAGSGEALSTLDSSVATNQIGHVVPYNGEWTSSGGEFVLWRCFLHANASTAIGGSVPAHYAQTTSGPGNTYCTTWDTGG